MLQQDPSKRPSIEGILTHPWFKLTLVDKWSEVRGDGQSLPPTPGPCTPLNGHKEFDFSEPFRSGDPGPSSSRFLGPHSGLPSPLSTHLPQIPSESEPSETSFEFADSEQGKPDSGTTTPTTAEDEETELIKRNHSGELSHTEKVLELLHPNGSQSTIRRSGSESPGSATAFGVKNRVAIKSSLEGQTEVDEDMITDEEVASREQSASLPMMEEHSLHLPLAQHSRTPSRTKRRSVSSTLSLERRNSHHSQSGQWQTYPPEDYLAKLNEEREVSFSKPSERQLLTQLSDLGFDTGQLIHSVNSDACDASAAIWWILRQKQLERGEPDEVVETRNVSVARRRDRAPANAREERRRARKEESAKGPEPETKTPNVTFKDQTTSIPVTPSVSIVDLGEPVSASGRPIYMSPEQTAKITVLRETPDAPPSEGKPVPSIRQAARVSETSSQPHTPPRELRRKEQLTSPSTASPSQSGKTRSPSVSSMLQRATSAIVGGSKKSEDPESVDKNDARSVSPTKPTKLPPNAKIARSESESTLLSVPHSSPVGSIASLPSDVAAPRQAVSTQRSRSPASSSTTHGPAPNSFTSPSSGADLAIGRMKASKRDSLWSTFRQLFIEDKRRRKGEISGSPLAAGDLKIAPAVVPSRGIGARAPHVNRVVQPISANAARRISIDVHPHPPSRRSSSVNSRRSSVTSMHLPSDLHEIPPALARRHSHKSHGSETPNSDREYQEPNRPSSAHSDRRGSSRRSSQTALRSPSMQSDTSGRSHQNSPLHNYQRSSPAGFASTRVRHLTLKAVPTAQGRTGSRASSVRSNASSRASSVDRGRGDNQDSDYDTRREDASMRSKRRKSSVAQLVQLIHRPRSPLTHPGQLHIQHPRHVSAVKRKAPLRDVFKHKNDDWVSEDDEPITSFAGGLGQGRTNTAANSGSNWAAAAAHPNALAKQHGRAHRQGHSRNRRGSSDEEKEKKGTVMSEVPNISGVKRTGLPDKMGRAPVIQEEEEEEE